MEWKSKELLESGESVLCRLADFVDSDGEEAGNSLEFFEGLAVEKCGDYGWTGVYWGVAAQVQSEFEGADGEEI